MSDANDPKRTLGQSESVQFRSTQRSSTPDSVNLYAGLGAVLNRLEDHAITLGDAHELVEPVLTHVGLDVEAQADIL